MTLAVMYWTRMTKEQVRGSWSLWFHSVLRLVAELLKTSHLHADHPPCSCDNSSADVFASHNGSNFDILPCILGIYLSDHDHDCLTNLRFADDVLLFATSKEQLQKMLYEFKESTETVGLRIHPGKTKVLSNQSSLCSEMKKEMQIDDIKIEILTRSESVRHLGQLITFQQQETTEIKNRIRAAWATFHKYRQ